MKTREQYAVMAERLADKANHYTYGDGGDSVTGGALAAEALVYATLATVAPDDPELDVLRVAVAELLHDAATSADDQAAEVIRRFREGLADTTYGVRVLAVAEELMQALEYDPNEGDRPSATELHEQDQADEAALDAAADAEFIADTEGTR